MRARAGGVGAWYAFLNVLRGVNQSSGYLAGVLTKIIVHVVLGLFVLGLVGAHFGVDPVNEVVEKAVALYVNKDGKLSESFWPDEKGFKGDLSKQVRVVDIDEDPWCGEHPCGLLLANSVETAEPAEGWKILTPVEFFQ